MGISLLMIIRVGTFQHVEKKCSPMQAPIDMDLAEGQTSVVLTFLGFFVAANKS